MFLNIHVHHHYPPEILAMSEQLDQLTANVAAMSGTVDSAVTLLQGLAAQIEDLKDDPEALQALADDVRAQSQKLADAVATNDGNPDTNPVDGTPEV